MIKGWLLDCYPSLSVEGMTFWIKTENGENVRLKDSTWHAKLYAAGSACDSPEFIFSRLKDSGFVSSVKVVKKRTSIFDWKKNNVLEIELRRANRGKKVADLLESIFQNPSTFRLYNVDIAPEQQYFLEKDLFPLAYLSVHTSGEEITKWRVVDGVEATDYKIPRLKVLGLSINLRDQVPRMDSGLDSITLTPSIYNAGESEMEPIEIEGNDEGAILTETAREVRKFDPDFIITGNGDAFVFPYLYSKAQKYLVSFNLDRDPDSQKITHDTQSGGRTYFSYGRIMYRPTTQRFYGRIHVDGQNTFIYDQCRFEGLFEIARISRMPFHTSSRASIGKSLSGLQFYYAHLRDTLIPYKPVISEDIKNMDNLLVADRGGLVFVPLPGVHERVCEFDFASLYPSIIKGRNISAETVNCPCCPDSDNRLPDLDVHICKRKLGIVPQSLALPLSKRFEYKRLRDETSDVRLKQVYNERAGALKWILVTCLARESPVLIKQNGLIRYVKIGDFIDDIVGEKVGVVDCPADISVAGIGHDLKSKFCSIKKLLRVPNHQKLLGITMDDGRRVIATPDHPFYLLKNGHLKVRQASKLKVGNFIPIAKKLPSSDHSEKFIDVIVQLMKKLDRNELMRWRVSGQVLPKLILDNKRAVFAAAMKEGYSDVAVRQWIKTGRMPLRFFHLLDVPFEMRRTLHVGIGRIKGKWGVISWIPAVIPISEELGFFLGLYVADGSASNTYIRLDIGYFETDLLENACKITESLFQTTPRIYKETGVNMYVAQINNLALVKFMEQILDLPSSSEKGKLKVPEIALNSDKMVAQGFLEGMLAGDGSMSKTRNFASIATASRDFANQIGFLATMQDLGFRLAVNRERRNTLYSVNFVGPETLKRISEWRFLKKAHLAILEPKLKELCRVNCAHPFYQLFPTEESNLVLLARKARTVRTPRIDRRDAACPYRITQTIERICVSEKLCDEESIISFENVKRMFQGDLGFARIRKVEKFDRTDEHVYCFQLADDELPGFFTGDGVVFTHNCFGYLSFRHAKFMKIDAHIAVCSVARQALIDAMHTAESRGFRTIHGIVDSLWVYKERAKLEDYEELRKEIEDATKFKLAIEGIYKWIVFLPSKVDSQNQVPTRYFGCFEKNNEIKVRGIEYRRHDTPIYFKKCQEQILKELAECDDEEELRACARSEGVQIFDEFAGRLERHDVTPNELLITRRLSKNLPEYYSKRQLSVNAALKLEERGLELKAGQSVSYVITKYKTLGMNRALPEELASISEYDSGRYVQLLADCCATILSPFGVNAGALLSRGESLLSWI